MLLVCSVNTHRLFFWEIKKDITATDAFQKVLDESNRKPSKIWVGTGSEFYKRSMKSWLRRCHANVLNT